MEIKALALALLVSAALLLTELPSASAQVFCRSQFNLANEACSLRSFVPGARRPGLPREQLNETSLTTTSAAAAGGSSGDQALQSRDDEDDEDDDSGRRSSRHHHRHYSEEEDPRDTACCRRIMGLDNSCVCQATARLPPFMNSIRHTIKLTPIEGCEVTFECPGPLF
ncbi:hypothetical protein PR202_ga20746 [Eleusine coracana subsp. coracana]|uniref:Bifunctional inhibitor/plant lipid transfer protein/seed storage helical domain-containing protein n=1 Tax=Eleusine coracana subsp. coracana TaxID=191504 RepID=A0AAV5CYV9_ELECO|nr:hypothetical protein QOZ80_8AG0627660 [Eleusine coracana subsp. coracana]GJN03316.1 hypothetical protein PR202_ga20746 [Eleusine coracana subsp. coracana]